MKEETVTNRDIGKKERKCHWWPCIWRQREGRRQAESDRLDSVGG